MPAQARRPCIGRLCIGAGPAQNGAGAVGVRSRGWLLARNLALTRVYGISEQTVADDTAFLSPKVEHLYKWWRGRALAAGSLAGRLPLRREFDIGDHLHVVPDLFLVEVMPEGGFLLKLEGEKVIELFGINITGRVITEGAGEADYGHALAEYYRGIVEEGLCRRCVGNLEQINDRRWIEFESIDCPLSRDGSRVDYIIGVAVGIREKRL